MSIPRDTNEQFENAVLGSILIDPKIKGDKSCTFRVMFQIILFVPVLRYLIKYFYLIKDVSNLGPACGLESIQNQV